MKQFLLATAFAAVLPSCAIDDSYLDYIDLVVENRVGAELWYFDYAACGTEQWFEALDWDEVVDHGDDAEARNLDPGCYELYVEDEWGCWAFHDTGGNVEGGDAFYWTVKERDLYCP